jgi:hypothetical protein
MKGVSTDSISRNRSSFNNLLLISTFQEFPKRFEQSKAVERLERLERIGPHGDRSKAIERLEHLELAAACVSGPRTMRSA